MHIPLEIAIFIASSNPMVSGSRTIAEVRNMIFQVKAALVNL